MTTNQTFTHQVGVAVDAAVSFLGLGAGSGLLGGLAGGALGMMHADSAAMAAHLISGTGAKGVAILTGEGTSMVLAGGASGFAIGSAVAAGAFAAYAAYKAVSYYGKHHSMEGFANDFIGLRPADERPAKDASGDDQLAASLSAQKLSAEQLAENLGHKLEALKAKRAPAPAPSAPKLSAS